MNEISQIFEWSEIIYTPFSINLAMTYNKIKIQFVNLFILF